MKTRLISVLCFLSSVLWANAQVTGDSYVVTLNNVSTGAGAGTIKLSDLASTMSWGGQSAPTWASITSKPTTLAGFGITDAQGLDADLTSWAAVTRAAGFDTFTATPSGANLASLLTTALPASKGGTGLTALSANVVTLLGAADYAAVRTALSLTIGTNVQAYDADLDYLSGFTPSANVKTILNAADFAAVRTALALTIGTNVQAYDADLTTYAGITPSANVQTLLGAADFAAFKTSLSLNSVENTALSTWAGTANLTTVGTIGTGTWNATAIADGKIASALTGKSYAGSTVTMTGAISTSAGSIGYATGAGGTVTQATSKTTGVTLNKICGQITMHNAALAAAAEVAFTLTNSTIAATDTVLVTVQSVGTAGSYTVNVGAVAAGSCSITVGNVSAGSLSQAVVLNFAVLKAVTS